MHSIKEAEDSPENLRFTRESKAINQFNDAGEDEMEELRDNNYKPTMKLFDDFHPGRDNAKVKYIDDNANTALPPSSPNAYKLTTQSPSFTGLGNQENGLTPSDAQIAVGLNHIVVLANNDARIINKQTGALISDVTLTAFFGWSGFVFDPRIFYDPYGQRFVALALQSSGCSSDSRFRVLISNNSDPTQGWFWYEIDVDGANSHWLDFAMLGFNKDWIAVAGNSLCGASTGIWVLPKSTAYTGASITYYFWNSIYLAAPAFTFDNTIDKLYLVKSGNSNISGTGYVDSWYISGNAPSLTASYSYGTSPWQSFATDSAHCPKQLGGQTFTSVNIFGHAMTSNCVYRNGYLWFAHPVFLPATGTTNRSSLQWWQVNPATGAVQQVGRVDDGTGGISEYYPSLGVNAAYDVSLSYSIFSSSYYQSAAYNFRSSSDAAGTLPNAIFYYSGGAVDGDGRGGDYAQSAIDPLDDMSIWMVNQVPASTGYWETRYTFLPAYYGCYTDATFGNSNWSGNTKNEASNSITSAEMIQPYSNVEYDAGSYVTLSPGFVANQGSYFKALIDGCNGLRVGHPKSTDVNRFDPIIANNSPDSEFTFSIFPNPNNGRFTIAYTCKESQKVDISIYNIQMQKVQSLSTETVELEGFHQQYVDLSHLTAGIYFCRATIGKQTLVRKVEIQP